MKKNDEAKKKRVCLGLLTHPLFVFILFNQIIFFRIRLFLRCSDEEADEADVGDE